MIAPITIKIIKWTMLVVFVVSLLLTYYFFVIDGLELMWAPTFAMIIFGSLITFASTSYVLWYTKKFPNGPPPGEDHWN